MTRPNYFDIELTDAEFGLFRTILESETGIVLKPSKRQLLKNRLRPLLVAAGNSRYGELLEGLDSPDERFIVLATIIDAVTTNLTHFFREPHQFEVLAERVLPEMVELFEEDKAQQLTIWSAGCSTGPEVYSTAMVVREVVPRRLQKRVRVLATDIDTSALGRARRGVYGEDEIFGLSPERIQQHMRRTPDGTYEISAKVKELIRFTPRNLIQPATWGPGGYAAIFCRNVLIYFSAERRDVVRRRLVESLRPGGYLFLGHSEGIPSRDRDLEYVCPSTYQRRHRE